MARNRDYAKEYRNRTVAAVARGHRSYGAERHAIETGKIRAIQPTRVTNPITEYAQLEWEYREAMKFSNQIVATEFSVLDFDSSHRADGVSDSEYQRAYYDAFIQGDGENGTSKGSPELKYWLTEINDFMTPEEYDDLYSEA